MTHIVYQRLNAPADSNGNRRRLVAAYDLDAAGDVTALYVPDYRNVPAALRGLVELPEVNVTAAEYRAWLAEYSRAGKVVR